MWKDTDIYTCTISRLTCEIIHSQFYSTQEIADLPAPRSGDQRLSREQNIRLLYLKGTPLVNDSKMDYKPFQTLKKSNHWCILLNAQRACQCLGAVAGCEQHLKSKHYEIACSPEQN